MSGLFEELKRRNVFRVALAYLAAGWLVLQVVELVLESTSAPDWVMQVFLLAVAVGFPFAVLFAWAYEMTPEGIKREKDVDRSQSITPQTGRKLNRTIIIVLVAAVAILLIDKFVLQTDSDSSVAATDKSVAVLPFVAMSNGPDDEYFADGLTEEILNSLTRVPELLVTARTSAFHFKGQDIPIPEIAATLGVAHVVEGSVRRAGEQLRITAQLIRAADGFHLWSETYDHDTADTFGVQTDIAEKIATALDVVLDDEQLERMRRFGLRDPAAFVAFQKGLELFDDAHGAQGQVEQMLVANRWFQQTMELAPEFADSYSYHADYFTHVLLSGILPDAPSEEDLQAAMQSFEEDMNNAIRHAPDAGSQSAYAYDLDLVSGRWRGLHSRFDRIVELNSCFQPAWPEMVTSPFGKAADVHKLMQRSIECDPLSFSGWMTSASSSQWLGDFESALETARRGYDATGHRLLAREVIASLVGLGRFDEARSMIEREVRDESGRARALLRVDAAEGVTKGIEVGLEQVANETASGFTSVMAFAVTGQRQRANELAAEIDATPYGYLNLSFAVHTCLCGAPFDLEATPNYARRIEDAGFSWPPPSPINFPLKDW
jgi:TolB-like protein